jgi:hypothetical protein
MPDVETQTEDFIILSKEQLKQMTIPARKIYKNELKEYKHEQSIIRHRNYCREYQRTWNRMKYKYDPEFKKRHLENVERYKTNKKLKKQLEKEIKITNITQQPGTLPADAEKSIIDSFRLLMI